MRGDTNALYRSQGADPAYYGEYLLGIMKGGALQQRDMKPEVRAMIDAQSLEERRALADKLYNK